jgi:hypothetical protein
VVNFKPPTASPLGKNPAANCVGSRAGINGFEERNISFTLAGLYPRPSSTWSSRYTDKVIQSDQKVSVYMMIIIQPTARARGDTRHTLTPSVIPDSNYLIMVGD